MLLFLVFLYIPWSGQVRTVQVGQPHGKSLCGHIFATVSMPIAWWSICLIWWIRITKLSMKEDCIVTCSQRTRLSRLMPILGKQQFVCMSATLLVYKCANCKAKAQQSKKTNKSNRIDTKSSRKCYSFAKLLTLSSFCLSFSAAVAEMLVQSTVKDLYLLPALPRDKWGSGCVKGLKARGRVTVNICWKEGDLHEVGLWSKEQNSVKRIHYRGRTVTANISIGRVYTFNNKLKCVRADSL